MKFLTTAFTTVFTFFIYRSTFFCAFLTGFLVGEAVWSISFAMLLIFPLAVPVCLYFLFALITCAISAINSGFSRNWAKVCGHALMPVFALLFLCAGFFGAELATIVYVGIRLEVALADFGTGSSNSDEKIEIISISPKIALFKLGETSGFGNPGLAHFILLDQTGQFKAKAEAGHARDLAGNETLRSRKYSAWCQNLAITPESECFIASSWIT